jgi:hypothetical protein
MRHGTNIHCALLVELGDQRYLLDPGYLVAEPVPLRAESTVRVSHPGHQLEYRPVGDGSQIELHTLNDRGEELLRYRLRPRPIPEDMFVQHWLDSFDANGMNGLRQVERKAARPLRGADRGTLRHRHRACAPSP